MNKLEKTILIGVRNALLDVITSQKGDDWEKFAHRMKDTIKSNMHILNGMLTIEEDKEESENTGGFKL